LTASQRRNQSCAVLSLRCGVSRCLLPGDSNRKVMARLNPDESMRWDIVIAPHHGGNIGSSGKNDWDWFVYEATKKPDYMIVSAGSKNPHGHPTDDVIASCRENDCKILCTELTPKCYQPINSAIADPPFNRSPDSYGSSKARNASCCFGTIIIEYYGDAYSVKSFSRMRSAISNLYKKNTDFTPQCLI
ncbi:MAG: hypothetical protein ACOC29_01275, partial [Candidatus Sumerlaeota bacterium]